MMGGGLFYWLIGALLLGVPLWKLLPRAGMSPYLALLSLVPALGIVLLWIVAFKDDVEGKSA
jgi:hypothetical protein